MWYESESGVRPQEVDTESSKRYVYVRKDIKELERETEEGKETYFSYLEQKIAREDWEVYQKASEANESAEQNRADIAYVAIMTGVEL